MPPTPQVLMGVGVWGSQLPLSAGTCQLGSRDVSTGVLGNQVALLPADAPSQGKRFQMRMVPDSHSWHRGSGSTYLPPG